MTPHWPPVKTDRSIGCPLRDKTEPPIERIKGTLAHEVPCDARCRSANARLGWRGRSVIIERDEPGLF